MICPKCQNKQIGGTFCVKCGSKLESSQKTSSDQINKSTLAGKKISEKDIRDFKLNKQDIPPPPEHVQKKFLEKQKYKLKGFSLFLFWIKNLIFRGVESVIFSTIFHGGAWLLIQIANFFGGMVAPENEIRFDLYPPYQWEYIIFAIITIFTFRKKWGT